MSIGMWIALFVIVLTFIIKIPIGIGMLLSSITYLLFSGMDLSIVVEIFTAKMFNNFILLAVPLFIFAANLMNSSKVTEKIFGFANLIVGRWRGGQGHVNVIASLIFSGMTGSAVADASGLGIMEIETMRKEGYDDSFSSAITASSAIIGPIFPPSIPLVIYGVIAGVSIGDLFLAGMFPGVLLAVALCGYVAVVSKIRNYPLGVAKTLVQAIRITVNAIPALLTPVIILLGIYSGVMTATEAGAVAGLYALLISAVFYRSLGHKEFIHVLIDTVKATGKIGILLGSAYVFSYIIAVERLPQIAGKFITSFATTKFAFLILLNLSLFILGMFIDSAVLQLIFLPILVPIARSFDLNLVHFGIIFTLNTMIGLCTPPYGVLLFIVNGISGASMKSIIKEVLPIIFVMATVLLIMTYVPGLVLWVPRLFGRM